MYVMYVHVLFTVQVDDLKEGTGAEYVDVSATTLVLITGGYFGSTRCVISNPAATLFAHRMPVWQVPIVCVSSYVLV
jgi:hypothetical protein